MDWQAIADRLAPILALVFGLATAAVLFIIYRERRRARATYYGFVRERSTVRARQLLVLATVLVTATAASTGLWAVSIRSPELLPTPIPTATFTLIPSPVPRSPTPTWTPTLTPTVTPTPTETPIPEDADLPLALRTSFPARAVTPGPDAALIDLVLAAGEKDNTPIDPTTSFPKGTERVYAFLTFDGMTRDVPWVHAWYSQSNGQMVELWSNAELWSYDIELGYVWRYFECEPGRYELHIYVDHRLQQKVPFSVSSE